MVFISISLLSSVQSLSRVRLFATPWTVARQASLSITNSRSLLKLTSIKSMKLSQQYSFVLEKIIRQDLQTVKYAVCFTFLIHWPITNSTISLSMFLNYAVTLK